MTVVSDAPGSRVNPPVVQPLEPVTESNPLRLNETHGGISNLEVGLFGRDMDFAPQVNRFVIDQDFFDCDRRRTW